MGTERSGGEQTGHERRTFLRGLLTGSLVMGALGLLGGMIAYVFPPERQAFRLGQLRVRVGREGEIPIGGGKQAQYRERPVWVLHLKRGYVAFSAMCTHQGCIVRWDEDRRLLSCPCHNGLFDTHGNVVSGLPRKPLARYRVEVVRGEIFLTGRSGEGT